MFYTKHMITRRLQPKIEQALSHGLVAIVYGARQTGKTTIAKQIADTYTNPLYLTCDDPTVVANLTEKSATELGAYIGNANMVIIDEAQRVENIGISIKLIHDTYPSLPLLVTGSSSLDLANKIAEPLTGRSAEFILYPLSVTEVSNNSPEIQPNGNILMIRGGYPGLWKLSGDEAEERLRSIALNYLYRDAFSPLVTYDRTLLNDLLRLLAYQVGSEVNYSELGNKLSISKETVKRYIDLLEKAFIIFRLNQYRKNKRTEVGRLRKVYFYDLGIRNALVDDFRPLSMRTDVGALWENYCIVERQKFLSFTSRHISPFYWRNNNQREIDYVEEEHGNVSAYEFKLGKKTPKLPAEFSSLYQNATYTVIGPDNFSSNLLADTNQTQLELA